MLPIDIKGVMMIMIPLMVTLTLVFLDIIVHISGSQDDNSVHYIRHLRKILHLQKSLHLRDISHRCCGSLHQLYLRVYVIPSLAFSFHLSVCVVYMVPFYKLIKSISLLCIYRHHHCCHCSLQHSGLLC